MEKLHEIWLNGSAIKELPDSFSSLTRLTLLEVGSCKFLKNLPSTLFMLPHFGKLYMKDCPQLVKSLEVDGVNSPSLASLLLDNCRLSNNDLHTIFNCFPNLGFLSLNGSNLESLPACIKEATNLRSLCVDDCKNLREIPSNLNTIMARNCKFLTSESSSILWSQALKELFWLEVRMPATNIPEWFDHCYKGETISFWIRKKFPIIALAFVFKNLDKMENKILSQHSGLTLKFHISINGTKVSSEYFLFPIVGGHVGLFDLRDVIRSEKKWMDIEAFLVDDWNYVEIFCSNKYPELPKMTVEYCGVHVYKQETNMEDIQFYCPVNPLKRQASFSPQHGRQQKLIKGGKDKGKGKLDF